MSHVTAAWTMITQNCIFVEYEMQHLRLTHRHTHEEKLLGYTQSKGNHSEAQILSHVTEAAQLGNTSTTSCLEKYLLNVKLNTVLR